LKITTKPVVYIISDSIGETAEFVVRAAASQFNSGRVEIRRIPFAREKEHITEVIEEAGETRGIIVYTLVLPKVKEYLEEEAAKLGIPTVDIMGPILKTMARVFPEPPHLKPGLVYKLDEEYYRKVEAIDFAVRYDDGKDPRGVLWADVVIIGVSRTSKTPLCMYLAHRGIKAANVPLVPEVKPAEELFQIPAQRIVGLTINPDQLARIRQERLKNLGLKGRADYVNPRRIEAELEYAEEIMQQLQCPIVQISSKAVEETAGEIMQIIKKG